ncbi:CotH kinase family protein [Hymenobacter cellulosivorans]|uniref:CotH kinase family protein n=1 Tax=Hymenobacter cellulosivorans TaxID=2932249 RepID=A0ABY4FFM8_9BACT|nr:CotH kinase family protein [Hymenobacter cellulosivorans]UOQ54813.1 CotH kinase family protein [Hymenobacter cellulosivorans]
MGTPQTNSAYQVTAQGQRFTLYFTQLPVVHLDARNPIVDSPSTYAKFTLAEPNGTVTELSAGVEIRGAYSQTYPKKSYELSLWNDTTGATSRDARLLQMRTDNKWNLQALYNEPLRLRSKVANEVWLDMHQIYYKASEPDAKNGIATAYVEVFVNNEYKGIYSLTERVDRKQLKLKKYDKGIKGELYKGSSWDGAVTFTALPPYDNTSETWGGFEYKHPEEEINWSNLYAFVGFVKSSSDQEFYSRYQEQLKLDNAVDYYIFLNLLRATDNTGKNLYIAKYKTGEPYFFVPWDLDGVFGTDWQGLNSPTTDDLLSNGLFDRLSQDCAANGFRSALSRRWTQLRTTVLTEDRLRAKFAAAHNYLQANNVYARERHAWRDFTYSPDQLTYMNTWLHDRLAYLDVAFTQPCSSPTLATATSQKTDALTLYPNPANDYIIVTATEPYELCVRDLRGQMLLRVQGRGRQEKITLGTLAKGLYVATITGAGSVRTQKLVIN